MFALISGLIRLFFSDFSIPNIVSNLERKNNNKKQNKTIIDKIINFFLIQQIFWQPEIFCLLVLENDDISAAKW